MKTFCLVLGIIFFLSHPQLSAAYEKEIKNLSSTMADQIAATGKKRVAVVDFTDLAGNVTQLGRFIAEEFSVALLNVGKGFEIVDRTHLQSILKEHKLSAKGIINPDTARKLGKIAGVDALVTGTITPFGDSVRLSVKILNVETARLIGANTGNIPATEAIKTLLESEIDTDRRFTTSTNVTRPRIKTKKYTETEGFTFALKKCKRSGKSLTCHVLITSKDKDKTLRIYRDHLSERSRVIDDIGKEYTLNQLQFANKTFEYDYQRYIENLLVANIPTAATLIFEDFSSEAESIALFELGCRHERKIFRAKLTNIPFSK